MRKNYSRWFVLSVFLMLAVASPTFIAAAEVTMDGTVAVTQYMNDCANENFSQESQKLCIMLKGGGFLVLCLAVIVLVTKVKVLRIENKDADDE